MRRIALLTAPVALIVAATTPGVATGDVVATSDERRYREEQPVVISVENNALENVTMAKTWTIVDTRTGETEARYEWSDADTTLRPGDRRAWTWNQRTGCHGQCAQGPSAPVGPGRYQLKIETSYGTHHVDFQIGEYFTIGFEGLDEADFIVYVSTADEVDRMRKEASAKDKTLIVSGIVKGKRRFNGNWNFTMGPGTIELGEAFVEACDAAPSQVARNRKEWLGARWCPWSSYVKGIAD